MQAGSPPKPLFRLLHALSKFCCSIFLHAHRTRIFSRFSPSRLNFLAVALSLRLQSPNDQSRQKKLSFLHSFSHSVILLTLHSTPSHSLPHPSTVDSSWCRNICSHTFIHTRTCSSCRFILSPTSFQFRSADCVLLSSIHHHHFFTEKLVGGDLKTTENKSNTIPHNHRTRRFKWKHKITELSHRHSELL